MSHIPHPSHVLVYSIYIFIFCCCCFLSISFFLSHHHNGMGVQYTYTNMTHLIEIIWLQLSDKAPSLILYFIVKNTDRSVIVSFSLFFFCLSFLVVSEQTLLYFGTFFIIIVVFRMTLFMNLLQDFRDVALLFSMFFSSSSSV